jgi:hypothetical protein
MRQDCVMQLGIDPEFLSICQQVVAQDWTDEEWSEGESSDWFQKPKFSGGYDADEGAFCFSFSDPSGTGWWFQVTLSEAWMISAGEGRPVIELTRAK